MSEQPDATPAPIRPKSLGAAMAIRFILLFPVLGLIFFLPAWTLCYWQAWVYIFIVAVPAIFLIRYLYKNDRGLLERRMRMREKLKGQKIIVAISWIFCLAAFIMPGFDYRFHWSEMPLAVVILSEVLVLAGYLIVALVFKANSYASRIIEVEKGQKVITTGPYAIVRHPMYLGVLIFYIFSPLALGSYWAVIPALFVIPLIIARIRGEEKELVENLEGYRTYAIKTRYRLLPGIW
jgi:protein-S-isoprenylcysteine O-methyltransferase Ste14